MIEAHIIETGESAYAIGISAGGLRLIRWSWRWIILRSWRRRIRKISPVSIGVDNGSAIGVIRDVMAILVVMVATSSKHDRHEA
jgi:hypothetical protein